MIVGEGGAESSVVVEHAGDAVEAEAVEVEFVDPVAGVGEEKVEDFGFAVVEAAGVPGGVVAAFAGVEILIGGAVEAGEAFGFVFDGVGVNEVDDDGDAGFMRGVDELFEFFGGAEAGGGGEEVGDVIAEGAIVGVFHDAHELDGVVAGLNDAGQGVLAKFGVGADFGFFLCHADVGFIDEGVANAFFGLGMVPGVGGGWIPNLGGEDVGLWVLNGAAGIGGYAFAAAAGPKYLKFVEVFVLEDFKGEFDFPDAGLIAVVEGEGFLNGPVGEVADEIEGGGVGCPFSEDPFIVAVVQAEIFVCIGKFIETHGVLGEAFFKVLNKVGAAVEFGGVGLEEGVLF